MVLTINELIIVNWDYHSEKRVAIESERRLNCRTSTVIYI